MATGFMVRHSIALLLLLMSPWAAAADVALIGTFVTLALRAIGDLQSHKRWMLLATLCLIGAAIARWPLAEPPPVPKGVEVMARGPIHEAFATPTVCGGHIFLRVAVKEAGGRAEKLYCLGLK